MYKVIIVEDEKVIIEGIINLINWVNLNCRIVSECSSGLEALNYIQNNEVDILISDIKMPGMNGLELIKKVRDTEPDVKCIILTAYSDFHYAQKAIRYGALDFIMKNDFVIELPKAVELAIISIDDMRSSMAKESQTSKLDQQEINSIKSYILESMALSKLINNPSQIEKYQLDQKRYCVCSCEIVYYDKQHKPLQTVKMIEDILDITLKEYEYFVVNVKENTIMIIICEDSNNPLSVNDVAALCNKILLMVKEFMRIDIRFGISEVTNHVNNLNIAYEQAMQALSRLIDCDSNIMIYAGEDKISCEEIDIIQFRGKITERVFSKDYEEALEELDTFKIKVVEVGLSFQKCKMDVLNICAFILRKLDHYDMKDIIKSREKDIYKSVEDSKTIYSLFNVCIELIYFCKEIIEEQKIVKSYLINNIDQYIKDNYTTNISLEEMSDQLHVTKSYISRIYKKKKGITLSETINRYRVERAKELLKDSRYKIYEIGFMIGIDDAPYFTTLFKKYVGCSPSDYRNQY